MAEAHFDTTEQPPRTFAPLVVNAAIIGIAAGAAALVFVAVVDVGTNMWFPETVDYGFGGGELWWIAVTTFGGVVVGLLRSWSRVPRHPAGTFDAIRSSRVDYHTAPQLVLVSAVSLISGSSLGPFDAGARSGGAFGEWYSKWRRLPDEERALNAVSGTSGGIGALMTAPIISPLLVMEILKPSGDTYYRMLVPSLVAATTGFFVFYATVGQTFLETFLAPSYDVELWHFFAAIGLGVLGAVLALMVGITLRLLTKLFAKVPPIAKGAIGGLIVGIVGVVSPLAMFSGKTQLTDAVGDAAVLGTGVLVVAVLAKILLMAASLATGFIGGPVMPLLAIGGLAGLAVAQIFPDIPIGLALSAMLVGVPGARLEAPFAATALAALTVGLGPVEAAPATFAVVTSYLVATRILASVEQRQRATATEAG